MADTDHPSDRTDSPALPENVRAFLVDRRDHWRRRGGRLLVLPPTGPSRRGYSCDERATLTLAQRQDFAVEWPGGELRATEDDAILCPTERAYRHRWDPRRGRYPGLTLSAFDDDVVVQQRNVDGRRMGERTWRFRSATGRIFTRSLALLEDLDGCAAADGPGGGIAEGIHPLVATALDAVLLATRYPVRPTRGGPAVAVRCREFLREHLHDPELDVGRVAAALGYDRRSLGRRYRAETGATLRETLVQLRVQRGRELLRRRELSIAEVAARCGFADPTHFSRTFRRVEGFSPRRFRRHSHLEGEPGA